MFSVGDIVVADALRLERLLLWMTRRRHTGGNTFSRFQIDNAPNLSMLGYWHPGQHQLQIGNAIIESGTKVTPSTIIPSVKTLALELHFEVRNEVKRVPSLSVFPTSETVYVKSRKDDKPTEKVKLKFWEEACPVECIQHIKKLVIHEFKGSENERAFIKFIGERALVLEQLVLMPCFRTFRRCSKSVLEVRMRPFLAVKCGSKLVKSIELKYTTHPTRNFRMVIDVSCGDPFDLDSNVSTVVSSA